MPRKTFYIFVTPSLIIMVTLMIMPLFASFWLSLQQISFRTFDAPEFIGLDNYRFMLSDPGFWNAFKITMFYIVTTVPLQIVLGLIIALLLDQIRLFRGFYIAGTLLPFIVTPVVGTLLFRQMFDKYGLYPYVLTNVLNVTPDFFSPESIFNFIVLNAVWYVTPFAVIVLFAGLQTISHEILEAASVDGANSWQRLRHIILPSLRSLFIFIALINVMDGYRVFDSIFVLTKQNPIYSNVQTLMYYNFNVAVQFGQLGRANAMSILAVIGIIVILVPFLYMTYRQQLESR